MPLPPVDCLSDDEAEADAIVARSSASSSQAIVLPKAAATTSSRKKRKIVPIEGPEIKQNIFKIIQTTCECAKHRARGNQASCFIGFRNNDKAVSDLVSLRGRLSSLHKADADNKARGAGEHVV